MKKLLIFTISLLLLLGGQALAASSDELELLNLTNQARTDNGISTLILNGRLSNYARSHSVAMATSGSLIHTRNLGAKLDRRGIKWSVAGENIGTGYSVAAIHDAFMASSSHRTNILMTNYKRIAVGIYLDGDGVYWITVIFYG